ncbi:hypothetical protein VIGAN_06147400 [Vigna angularis var. angularis]|uniref:Uncharacterized protein n=1 Tax=Vigna angularis var. angularis TaxID=157739 RepID=A0A0S3SBK4_PHAAN|nr:hypothetical protein VIGAN_06147400 [Vigna angularis var. angularis]
MKRRRRSMVSNRSWWNWRRLLLRKKSELEELVKKKLKLKEALRESEEKVAALESSILQLREEAKEVERVILLLNEKAVENVENIDRGVNGIHDEGKGLKLQWPVVAAGHVQYITIGRPFYQL